MMESIRWAAAGTGFTFLMTTLGAGMVFLIRGAGAARMQRVLLGFAAGVMIAASMFGLLTPAIEQAEAAGQPGWVPAAGGFALGVGFLLLMDRLLPHLHPGETDPEGPLSGLRRSTLMVLAVTLHNIPEGMAVGLSFALAAQHGLLEGETPTLLGGFAMTETDAKEVVEAGAMAAVYYDLVTVTRTVRTLVRNLAAEEAPLMGLDIPADGQQFHIPLLVYEG